MTARYFLMLIVTFLVAGTITVRAQGSLNDPTNYVVVIGAFQKEENAKKHSANARRSNLKTAIGQSPKNGLFYVYVLQTDTKEDAVSEVLRIREKTPFKDCWVYTKVEPVVKKEEAVVETKVDPVVETKVDPVVVEVKKEEVKVDPEQEKRDKIKAEVASQNMTIKKGQTFTLNHLYFFRDAAIMRPESKFEADKLVSLMLNNPDLKIKIHGHTNGNDSGKIIRRDTPMSDMFSLDKTIEDYGSAKKLSQQRAECLRDYLVSQGIDSKRMTIKAWGGKKPIYPVDDPKAEANVRVEVEAENQDIQASN